MADALKKANAESKSLSGENKSLCTDLEKSKKNAAEREGRLAVVEEKIRSLEARLSSAETAAKALAPAMESTKQACYMLRLALTDVGACANSAPGEDGLTTSLSGRRTRLGQLSKWLVHTAIAAPRLPRGSFLAFFTSIVVTMSRTFLGL
jgi:predicted RNase H-like nuclease (RuvC/YqgF family)